MPTTKIYIFTCFIFLLFFSELHAQDNQNKLCLEDVLAFTQTDSFAINSLYKIVTENLSGQESLNVKIEGAISDPDFSFAIISMLPALKNRVENRSTLEFIYYKTNETDFKEVMVTNAISVLYPRKYFDYLIERAKYEFSENWERAVKGMHMEPDKIKNFISDSENISKAKTSFSSKLNDEYKVVVNGRKVNLINEFYYGLEDPRFKVNCSNILICISRIMHKSNSILLDKRIINNKQSLEMCQFFREDSNEMYFELLICMGDYFQRIMNSPEMMAKPIYRNLADAKLANCTNGGISMKAFNFKFCSVNCLENRNAKGLDKEIFIDDANDCSSRKQIEWGTINSK